MVIYKCTDIGTKKEREVKWMEKKIPYLKLKGYMAENQIKSQDVAKLLNLTDTTFSKKINRNGQDFNAEEIRIMCKEYKLDANVFFLV